MAVIAGITDRLHVADVDAHGPEVGHTTAAAPIAPVTLIGGWSDDGQNAALAIKTPKWHASDDGLRWSLSQMRAQLEANNCGELAGGRLIE